MVLLVVGIQYNWHTMPDFTVCQKSKHFWHAFFNPPSNQTIFHFVESVSCFPKFDVINLLSLFTQFFFDEMRHLMKLRNGPHLEAMNPLLSTSFELFRKVETFNLKFIKKLMVYFVLFFPTDISVIPKCGLQIVIE